MNLNTVPKGDMALGYAVAKKYSSPIKRQKQLMSAVKVTDDVTLHRLNERYLLRLQRTR